MTAICSGSFDPVTNGHIDIIRRTLRFADRVIVAICHNVHKAGHFTPEERAGLVRQALEVYADFERVEIRVFSGLLADFLDECDADVIVRGVRTPIEYELDQAQAQANRLLNPRLETLYIPADPAHVFLSSSIVKEIASFGGDISEMVPPCVAAVLIKQQ